MEAPVAIEQANVGRSNAHASGRLGLALSGGGSRAFAFHRGTVRALERLGLVPRVDVLSSVSGGSVFAAAWTCALADGRSTTTFLEEAGPILERGFIAPALLSPRAVKMLLPGFSRTNRLAEVFDDVLRTGKPLSALPAKPLLCMNATVLNHAQVARFSRGGFSCKGVGVPGPFGSYPEIALPVTVGFAAAASAAFPFGLPPLSIPVKRFGGVAFDKGLRGQRRLWLTDGGVLENLGAQTLLQSTRFGAEHIIVSDAGTRERAWQPSFLGRLASFGAFALTEDFLVQILSIMNDKENRSMRELVLAKTGSLPPPPRPRLVFFVRVDQTWDTFMTGIPASRRLALGGAARPPPLDADGACIADFLAAAGVDLRPARDVYEQVRDEGVAQANRVATSFTGIARRDCDLLARHAEWQMLASYAVYGPLAAEPNAASSSTASAP